ncbi:replicative DNA helicase [Paramuribaculum intestinale]|jgi:replicative DNA helicase|uniref:replicative DNA helicase n=2 Tax=Paramuribaculum intestinale TaxID=2094151 RepID=UPI000D1FBCA6|nr:replicative DNA helicase [Paramuribaculum intestinale]MBJ2186302.1 replicative DNA helicase [Muribaculaceae bacterium]ROT15059.1 replicative DNA helicase [Muribaculaceae bacterium Isolate-105 (HZI)]RXE62062.1 replicative DNA helicase [Muribaculaceae bacterium Isolate-004 (NCI)]MCX4328973.1 replicative DNA helicase [Paramuribaculum intestinale]PWB07842.1 replicative DNA helicase [Paramuribaculum intestinale]
METKRSNNYTPRAKNDADLGGRVPPRDLDVEQAVLGALMLEKDAYSVVCDLLKPESFYDPVNSMVYAAIQQLGAAQKPIDMLTVTEQLRLDGNLEKIGGPVVVSELTSRVLSGANVEYHARIVAQKYLARELISFSSDISTKAFDEVHDVDDLLQEAEGRLFEISQRNVKKDVTQINPVIEQAIKQIQAAANRASGLSGLESGFHELDKLTSGWQSSDLIIIAARPAMGKTAFVLSMAKNMAVNYEIPVAIFSLEMSNVQLVNRLISNVCELGGEKIKSGQLSPMEWDQLMSRVKELQDARLYIDDTPSLSILELRTKARRLVREHQVRFIIIDYLQLMNATGMKFGSREQEVSMISRSLKQLAKELDIPIVALSQLNRSVETRGKDGDRDSKRPQLSDLRESGAIEQDADIVCFIHRPEYYLRSDTDMEGRNIRGLAEFIVAKHRSGRVDDVKMRFRKEFARFENWEDGPMVSAVSVGSKMNASGDDGGMSSSAGATFSGGSADFLGATDEPTPF